VASSVLAFVAAAAVGSAGGKPRRRDPIGLAQMNFPQKHYQAVRRNPGKEQKL